MNPADNVHLLVFAAVLLAIVCICAGLVAARWWRGLASRARNRVARQGEYTAEEILKRAGYRIIGRQVTANWIMEIDGIPTSVEVRADLLVRRGGRTFVAEVKTGNRAPDPGHPPTRRQLLEYALVFGSDKVLLVDAQAGELRAVAFPAVRT